MIKYPCKTNFWAELVKLSDFGLWMTWSFGSLAWLSAAKLPRTCDRSSSLVRSWLIAWEWVECDYVECCSSKRGDHILITLFRNGFCSLLYKRGLGKKRSNGLCYVYVWREMPPKLQVGSKVFIPKCQLQDFLWIVRKMLLGKSSSYNARVLFARCLNRC